MTGARTNTLARLRGSIERIEAHADASAAARVALGHADADATLQGGLALAAMHEVFAEGRQSAAATGFIAGLAGRVTARRPLVWIRQDFAEIESGELSMSGFTELGLDPRCVVTVRAADVDTALRTAADALACDALGAVVLEVWGEAAAIRSRRQPQADAGGAGVGRHRIIAAGGGAASALDGGDAMDRARGAFAARRSRECVGRAGVRRATRPQSSWPGRAVDHGMEM